MALKDIMVEKRDGSRELYDVTKIKKSIQMASEGLDVNPLELESKLIQFLKPGIKTRDIQLNVIQHAIQLATPAAPDWVNVAGKALAMDEWANFSLRGLSFREVVHHNIRSGEYTADLLDFYSDADLDELGECIRLDRDLNHSYSSLVTAKKKYLGRTELNQHMHMVNAMRFGQHEVPDERIKFVKEVYNALSLRKISLATPFLSNLRKGGNVASCFIIAVEDDINSIFDNVKRVALISKNGGGLGIFLGYLRAKGSSVNGFPNAAGSIVQWVKVLNDTLVAVNQSFTAETLVETNAGDVRIDQVAPGTLVRTHDGTFCEVVDVRSRESDTPIVQISTSLGEVRVTSGHPVLAVRRDGKTADQLMADIKTGLVKPVWVDAGELTSDFMIIKAK